MSAAERAAVVAEAREWLGTPYHPHARVRGRGRGCGVDCAQLPIAVYVACGLIPEQTPDYARDWHLHQGAELYLDQVRRFATEVPRARVDAGDFALWRFGRTFSHGGIMTDPDNVIHAWRGVGVTLDRLDEQSDLSRRERLFFTLWAAS